MKRRAFLKKAVESAGVLAASRLFGTLGTVYGAGEDVGVCEGANRAVLPRRAYGKTGVMLSIVGLGGLSVVNEQSQAHVNRLVSEMVEKGLNYFDVAPTYGNAESRFRPAIEPYRKKIFLACKTTQRQREGAAKELANSLKTLGTDYLDLYQLHAISDVKKDVDAAFGKGGAMEVFLEAKKEGKVRHLGFSAHSEEAALAALERYDFDSVLFPVNFACWYGGDFGPGLMEAIRAKGVACLALKVLAREKWSEGDPLRKEYGRCWYKPVVDEGEQAKAFRFTLSLPVTSALPPGDERLFRRAVDLAMSYRPISKAEDGELRQLAGTLVPVFSKRKAV